MKTIYLITICMLSKITTKAQEVHVNDFMPAIKIEHIINGGKTTLDIDSLKGKVVILDFWATWCSPCVSALTKFESYKTQFGDRLVILAISDENHERLKQFIKNRPTSIFIDSDTGNSLARLFPHRIIPHTVLIGIDGKVNAITDAKNITPEILKLVLNHTDVSLPLKRENMHFAMEDYMQIDSSQQQGFNMLPTAPGAGTMSSLYATGFFKDRRLTIINMTLEGLFRLAYEKTDALTTNEYDTTDRKYEDEKKFCVDIWIAEPGKHKLLQFFRQKLKEQFIDVDAVLETKMMKVRMIKDDGSAKEKLKPSAQSNDGYAGSGANFEGKGVKVRTLADYLEGFAIFKGKVIDETGIDGRYDISFDWQPEEPTSLLAAFKKMGLYWEDGNREVEVLLLKKKTFAQ